MGGLLSETFTITVSKYHEALRAALASRVGQIIGNPEARAALVDRFPEHTDSTRWVFLSDHCSNHRSKGACRCATTENALVERVGRGKYRVL